MNRSNKIDLVVLFPFLIVSVAISLYFDVKPLTSALLFFGFPSIYLLVRRPKNIHRVCAGTFLFGFLFGFGFDFIALINRAWSEPLSQIFFPNKILNVIAIDHIIWFLLWTFSIITFYEHFIDHERSDEVSHNYKWGLYTASSFIVVMLLLYLFEPGMLLFRYAYFVLGIVATIPLVLLLIRRPSFYFKFIKVVPYFFILYLSYELVAIYLGQWYFPGQYIGQVNIFGLEFPFEEFFFWTIMSSVSVLSYYEIFVDDGR